MKTRDSSTSEWVFKPLYTGLGALHGPIILHTLPASFHRMAVSAFKDITNLNPNVIDALEATNDRMITKDELETMQEVTIIVSVIMSFVVQLLRLVGLRIFTANMSQDKKKCV